MGMRRFQKLCMESRPAHCDKQCASRDNVLVFRILNISMDGNWRANGQKRRRTGLLTNRPLGRVCCQRSQNKSASGPIHVMLIRHNAMHIRYATQRQHIVDSVSTASPPFAISPLILGSSMRCSTNFMFYPSSSHPPSSRSLSVPQANSSSPILANSALGDRCASDLCSFSSSIRAACGITSSLAHRSASRSYWILSGWVRLLSHCRRFVSLFPLLVGTTTAFTPSRTQLLLLDLLIIALSVIVTTVAYETAYARAVTKAAIRATLDLTPTATSTAQTYTDPLDLNLGNSDDVVLDLRASLLLRHVRRPPAPPPDDAPLPNGATIVEGLRVLLQAQRSFRTRQQTPPPAGNSGDDAETQGGERERERRVPGGMDPPEDS
jgi:hypothetical protein